MNEVSVNGNIGQIRIADEVLAIISGTAALEVNGVMAGSAPSHQGEMSHRFARRNFARGVKITITDEGVKVDITIMVKFGHKIHQVSEEVQKRIATALETMVGMNVCEVNVNVAGLRFEKTPQRPPVRR
ncbi:MAG: Asp23/Gls24 family envelope stress response protein [Defluviitaleaceae bacterium]|nr:Asp23/Gls24 family envelope stress response protein [Defluviitaleaceae bacterium]